MPSSTVEVIRKWMEQDQKALNKLLGFNSYQAYPQGSLARYEYEVKEASEAVANKTCYIADNEDALTIVSEDAKYLRARLTHSNTQLRIQLHSDQNKLAACQNELKYALQDVEQLKANIEEYKEALKAYEDIAAGPYAGKYSVKTWSTDAEQAAKAMAAMEKLDKVRIVSKNA